MKNKKLIKVLVIFLLLVPFRLPISVLLIELFTLIANIGTIDIPDDVMLGNIIVTKLIYNITLSVVMIYNIEYLSRDILSRKAIYVDYSVPKEKNVFWWTIVLGILSLAYIIYDGVATYQIAEYLF